MSSSFDDRFRELQMRPKLALVDAMPLYADQWKLITYPRMRRPYRRAWETRLSLRTRDGRMVHCYLSDYELRLLGSSVLVNLRTRRRVVPKVKSTSVKDDLKAPR